MFLRFNFFVHHICKIPNTGDKSCILLRITEVAKAWNMFNKVSMQIGLNILCISCSPTNLFKECFSILSLQNVKMQSMHFQQERVNSSWAHLVLISNTKLAHHILRQATFVGEKFLKKKRRKGGGGGRREKTNTS